jgi:hypothetical protein
MSSTSRVRRVYLSFLLPAYPAAVIFALHGVSASAADIARDTPAASMALATGLYATPGTSASVSTVTTPVVTASPLPPETPPQKVAPAAPAVAFVPPTSSANGAAEGATVAVETPREAGWTDYVAVIAGMVGAIAGIAGAIMGALGLRRVNRLLRRD